jgi:Spy/CpxP family protein refolding chaperone
MFRLSLAIATLVAACSFAQAQQRPYEGLQQRSIKALSDQDQADLRAGRGMGFALAAELNGYPGPAHVLELADKLALIAEQRAKVQALFDRMKAEAVPVGESLVKLEADLDRQFALKTATERSVAHATAVIGTTQGVLRNVHLKFHLLAIEVLTPEQVRRYSELRGYTETSQFTPHHQMHPR